MEGGGTCKKRNEKQSMDTSFHDCLSLSYDRHRNLHNVSLSLELDHNTQIHSKPNYRAVPFRALVLIKMLSSRRVAKSTIIFSIAGQIPYHWLHVLDRKITKSKLLSTLMLFQSNATSDGTYLSLCSAFRLYNLRADLPS